MKRICIILMVVLLVIIGCSKQADVPKTDNSVQAKPNVTDNTPKVRLSMTIKEWSSWDAEEKPDRIRVKSTTVGEGSEFGPIDYPGSSMKMPFKLLKILENGNLEVWFDDSLVIDGEPIANSSTNNPTIITNQTCFMTRTYDGGSNICVRKAK